MLEANATNNSDKVGTRPANSLCFIMDKDFIFRQGLAAELRRTGIDVVELSANSRLSDMVEDQNPDIVLVNVDRAVPHECVRTLLALKEPSYAGAVQLFGNTDLAVLELSQHGRRGLRTDDAAACAEADQGDHAPSHHSRSEVGFCGAALGEHYACRGAGAGPRHIPLSAEIRSQIRESCSRR